MIKFSRKADAKVANIFDLTIYYPLFFSLWPFFLRFITPIALKFYVE